MFSKDRRFKTTAYNTIILLTVDPNDAIPIKSDPKQVSKRKSTDTEIKDPEKKPKIDDKEKEKEGRKEKGKRDRKRSETKVEVDGTIETHTLLSPKTPPGDPPEPEELIKVILSPNYSSLIIEQNLLCYCYFWK